MNTSIIIVPASKLIKSPTNVRKTVDVAADARLEASIAARGVLQNVVGVPVARKKGWFRITAGGRRLDRVHALIAKGVFPPDYGVAVLPLTAGDDAIETSLSENFDRLGMNPADECRAFQDIIEIEKKTVVDVARRFGLTERFVQGRLRLAGLAEPIFEALREGRISLDVAIAYASTADTARQAAVFEQLANAWGRTNVNEIRRLLAQGSYKGGEPKALLVGRDAYLEAGGRIETDLFSSASEEIWSDGTLLDQLAETKLAAAAEQIRAREGYAAVRTVGTSHPTFSETYGLQRLSGTPVPLTEAEREREQAIEAEIASIETEAEGGGGSLSVEQQERIDALEEELGGLSDRTAEISEAQKASALAYVVIGRDGQPALHEELYIAPVERDEDDDDSIEGGDEDGAEGTAVSGKPVVSQRLGEELAMMKTELLALHVASDPQFALDLAIFFMAEAAMRVMGSYGLPTELRANAPSPRAHGFVSVAPAAEAWARLDDGLDRSWLNHEDVADRYDAFCALDETARAAWLGWAIARTLHAVPAGKTGSAMLDHLGNKLEIDVAAWWRPTARNYFDRISKPAILALFDEIGGPELRSRYSAARKHDLAASAESLFAGELIVEADIKARAVAWLPDAMRLGVPEALDAPDDTLGEGDGTAPPEADAGDENLVSAPHGGERLSDAA
jgi:ParB family chromosome partitioning protein